MKCGNQEKCENYLTYVKENKEGFPKDKHDEIIEIIQFHTPSKYKCRAIDGEDCHVVRTINLLEALAFKNQIN